MISLKDLLNENCPEVDRGKPCPGGIDDDWAGSKPRADRIAKLTGLRFGSQKRSRKQTASNRRSDHWVGSVDSYGIDLPARGRRGDNAWKQLRDSLVSMGWIDESKMSDSLLEPGQGKWVNFMHDGYRYQIGWNVAGHYDHIHIGVRKKGVSVSNIPTSVTTDTDSEQPIIDSADLKFGDQGTAVVDMQQRLMYALDDPFAVGNPQDDGIFGPLTEKGVITFQKLNNISPSGIYDLETRDALQQATAEVSPEEIQSKIEDLKSAEEDEDATEIEYSRSDAKRWGDNVTDALDIAALDHGIDRELLYTIAQIESGGNPEAKNRKSGASGLFQMMPKYFKTYGINNQTVWNPYINADAAAKKLAKRIPNIKKIIDQGDLTNLNAYIYMTHNQGAAGFQIIYNACKNYSNLPDLESIQKSAEELGRGNLADNVYVNMKANGPTNPCRFIKSWIRKYKRNREKITKRLT